MRWVLWAVLAWRLDAEENFGDQDNVPWRPELPKKEMWTAVMDELDRSLRQYPNVTVADLLSCPRHLVLVYKNRVFVTPSFELLGHVKQRDHLTMVASLLKRSNFSNGLYVVTLAARGNIDQGTYCPATEKELPFFVIAKKMGYKKPGILIPNPYFANVTRWATEKLKLDKIARKKEWEHRRPQAMWRGGIGCYWDCFGDMGSWRRWAAVVKSWKRPDVLDVKVLASRGRFSLRNVSMVDCEKNGLTVFPEMRDGYNALLNGQVSEFTSVHLQHSTYADYQYLLNLNGVAGGSYSRNLNYIWNLDAVVLMWDAHFVEWYFPALHHMDTHVSVDFKNVVPTIENLTKQPEVTAGLRRRARDVYNMFISTEGLNNYFHALFSHLRSASVDFSRVLDDPSTFNALLARLGCGRTFHLLEATAFDTRKGHADHVLKVIPPNDPDLPACAGSDVDAIIDELHKTDPSLHRTWILKVPGSDGVVDLTSTFQQRAANHRSLRTNRSRSPFVGQRRRLHSDASDPRCWST